MTRDDDNNGKKESTPPLPLLLPEQDDKNLGDDFTKAGEGKDLTNDQQ